MVALPLVVTQRIQGSVQGGVLIQGLLDVQQLTKVIDSSGSVITITSLGRNRISYPGGKSCRKPRTSCRWSSIKRVRYWKVSMVLFLSEDERRGLVSR